MSVKLDYNCKPMPTSFKGAEEFNIKKIKRKDIIKTFNNTKYIVLNDKGVLVNLKTLQIYQLKDICLEISSVMRDGIRIANRRNWKMELKRCRK